MTIKGYYSILFYSMLYSPMMSACKPLTTNCIMGTFLGEPKQAVAVILLPRLGLFLKKKKKNKAHWLNWAAGILREHLHIQNV